jgi:3-hydroxyacyl-CoA dehydrogenase / enoyl-CoA hydratase / 3-hydroxybutyryl-CoA epimerase
MAIFQIERGEKGIAHLVMDDPGRRLNVIDEAALNDLDAALATLEQAGELRGVIVRSGKPGSFIVGADVKRIAAITDSIEVHALVRRAHAAFGRLAALKVPTVAAIDGVCLGGGTELALACDSRIASEEPRTQIGLPEVLLGILPGFGGTTRLPRLVGLSAALDLILTGRSLDARRAAKIGLVAQAVPAAWLIDYAERRIAELSKRPAGRRRDRFHPRGLGQRLLDGTSFGRGIVLNRARALTRARTAGQYPAPIAVLSVLENGLKQRVEESLKLEANWVSDLVTSPVCKNLVRIFQLQERAKKDAVVPDGTHEPLEVRRMVLVGTGIMGAGVAELASRSGIEVRMRDVKPEALTSALRTVRSLIDERGRKRRLSKAETNGQFARVYPALDLAGLSRAEFAIEAVVEDLDVKRKVFAELEVRMRPEAILATNTSSLSVDALAAGLRRPERFCGFHFFNPVHRMPLVEVVRGAKTSDATLVSAVALARRLGKTPVVVADSPGFVVNRVLMPYLSEAMVLLEEGYPLVEIDQAMRRFGMPMGPFQVIDEVGLDVAKKVAGVLGAAFPDRMAPSAALDKLIAAGRLGRKRGRGFYVYQGKRRRTDPRLGNMLGLQRERRVQNAETLVERMVLAMVNESARCLEEGVARDAGDIDLAMIFGTGFPPFRGGPLRHADALGLPHVVARLNAHRAERGERFTPAKVLTRLADRGGSFTGPAGAETPAGAQAALPLETPVAKA